MNKHLAIFLSLIAWFYSCEDIYNPHIEKMDELLVVEARILSGQNRNVIRLSKTAAFNSSGYSYPPASGAIVMLVDREGKGLNFVEDGKTGLYYYTGAIQQENTYKLQIRYQGEIIETEYQSVPKIPAIDSIYYEPAEKIILTGTDAAAGKLRKEPGAQLFIDIDYKGDMKHYRFTHRKIAQYAYLTMGPGGIPATMYGWLSMQPREKFYIAGPGEYSSSPTVSKYPLMLLEQRYFIQKPEVDNIIFVGWIYIVQQFAISEQAYKFYSDLNSQLTAEGKLFDPLYTQARGNLTCITTPSKIILGNFEISTVREHRFYVQPMNDNQYFIKRIPYFYNIPPEGEILDNQPEWWESRSKIYPGF